MQDKHELVEEGELPLRAHLLVNHGTAQARRNRGKHLITTMVEHASSYEVFQSLEKEGFEPHKKPKIRISKEAQKRFKTKVRELTSRKYSIPMEMRIKKLNQFLVGWVNYYQLAETRSVFKGIEEWLRRRLRMIRWKEWKQPRTRVANLKKLKVSKQKAHEWGNSRKGYWRVSKSPILHKTLDTISRRETY